MLKKACLFVVICNFVAIIARIVKKGNRTKMIRKMVVAFMTLAFMYLVIGDLILFHQRAIFHHDAFAGQPLSKPDKSGKDHLYKLKDKKDRIHLHILTFVSRLLELQKNQIYISGLVQTCPCVTKFIKNYQRSSISFRGPPAVSVTK